MKLDIFTPDVKSKNGISINNLKGVELINTKPHSSMPHLLSSYDLLFLPLDFDEEGIIFSQFSMPTKVSEYMISGTPILVFADRRTALAKYALNNKWAYTISENKIEILSKGLHELYSNSDLRKEIASKAIKIAIQNENAEMVREEFRKALLKNLETTHQ
jgi:glycosyltransferase involved in cell wall biosynthesis